jgi:hypothetical protein
MVAADPMIPGDTGFLVVIFIAGAAWPRGASKNSFRTLMKPWGQAKSEGDGRFAGLDRGEDKSESALSAEAISRTSGRDSSIRRPKSRITMIIFILLDIVLSGPADLRTSVSGRICGMYKSRVGFFLMSR